MTGTYLPNDYTLTSIRDLKKGDRVLFYGSVFIVLEDSKIFAEDSIRPGFYAPCRIETPLPRNAWSADILNDYDGFQGTADCLEPVLNK